MRLVNNLKSEELEHKIRLAVQCSRIVFRFFHTTFFFSQLLRYL